MKKNENLFRGEDLESLSSYCSVKTDCIACESSDFVNWANSGSFSAVKCNNCGLIWMNPFLTNEGLSMYYNDYLGKRRLNNIKKMEQRDKQYIHDVQFFEHYISSGKILDVGCNGGFLLNAFNQNFEKFGVEIDQKSVDYAKKHFDFGNNINCESLEKTSHKENSFDAIVMRGTIEHVPNPVEVIEKVSKLLKEGGYYYICATPNGDSFSAELYRDKWTLFHPVQHIWHFSPKTLSLIANKFGLKLIAMDFPYLGTPYENVEEDIIDVANAIKLKKEGKEDELSLSPAFWGNMMGVVFQKIK